MGRYAADRSTIYLATHGTQDLIANITQVATDLQQYHHEIQTPVAKIKILQEVLDEQRDKYGSQTMLNQILIEKTTGQVSGLFCGDGGYSIRRSNGDIEHYLCGVKNSDARLSTKDGIIDGPTAMNYIVLNNGDTIVLYSDGVKPEGLKKLLAALSRNDTELLGQIYESIRNDDDSIALIYTHH